MKKITAIAVLDVGKTNKKVLIYSMQLELLEQVSCAIGEYAGPDNLKLEQPEKVFNWLCDSLAGFTSKFDIVGISVTTHGAMGVCLDDSGNITCPPVAYTNEPGSLFCDSFFAKYGSRSHLQRETASAEIGDMVNFAKMVHYWNINCPNQMASTRHILMYPQYFGYKLTGQVAAEPTMLGSHSYLYDHKKKNYSRLATEMGIADKLPKRIANSWEPLGKVSPELAKTTGVNPDCLVTIGVHDSNSSLLPYLLCDADNFILNSTGTWCVVMKPASEIIFDDCEIGKTVFYNQSVFGNPVKTSIFMGGLEYQSYMDMLKTLHNRSDLPELDIELYNNALAQASDFILPSLVKGAGMFPDRQATVVDNGKIIPYESFRTQPNIIKFFANYNHAVAILTASLVIQTSCALIAAGYNRADQIFVEGGFRHNQPYLQLLAAMYPDSNIYTTDISQATALGAAILSLAACNNTSPDKLTLNLKINKQPVTRPNQLNAMTSYQNKFMELLSKN